MYEDMTKIYGDEGIDVYIDVLKPKDVDYRVTKNFLVAALICCDKKKMVTSHRRIVLRGEQLDRQGKPKGTTPTPVSQG
jgi:hypothetical protein